MKLWLPNTGEKAMSGSVRDDAAGLAEAAQAIREGRIIAFPTETFYALGADAANETAIGKIFQIKGREETKPLLLLIAEQDWLRELTAEVPPIAEALMARFWPGPLTLLFPASAQVLPAVTARTGKVGIRLPGHPVARALVRAVGRAVTGTSANPSGQPPASSAAAVREILGQKIDVIVDGGPTAGNLGSTIVDLSEISPRILRQGVVPATELLPFLEGNR